jgi:predicted RNase H-like HicB family nuclease
MATKLTVDYWRDGAYFVGQVRELPAAISQGKTLEELEENLRDATRLVMADMIEDHAKQRPRYPRSLHVHTRKLTLAIS